MDSFENTEGRGIYLLLSGMLNIFKGGKIRSIFGKGLFLAKKKLFLA